MPRNIISFSEALDRTDGQQKNILFGNGFSIRHFNYQNLLDIADFDDQGQLKRLFEIKGTYDFEAVVAALEDSALVADVYEQNEQADKYRSDADKVRRALVNAVKETHPRNRDEIIEELQNCIAFLSNFTKIFTLNYDLLLYWAALCDRNLFKDGFGLGEERNGFRGPFVESALCNTFYLHGALHLFNTPTGEIEKQLMGPVGVIGAITHTILHEKRMPLYVSEGSTTAKMEKINSDYYLRHCFDKLANTEGDFFIFGHSAANNDLHIYTQLFNSSANHIYFFIHQPTANLHEISRSLIAYKEKVSSNIEFTFVDADSVDLWDNSNDLA